MRDRIADILARTYDGHPLADLRDEHAAIHLDAADQLIAAGIDGRAVEARTRELVACEIEADIGPEDDGGLGSWWRDDADRDHAARIARTGITPADVTAAVRSWDAAAPPDACQFHPPAADPCPCGHDGAADCHYDDGQDDIHRAQRAAEQAQRAAERAAKEETT